jgi:hypothetical protein
MSPKRTTATSSPSFFHGTREFSMTLTVHGYPRRRRALWVVVITAQRLHLRQAQASSLPLKVRPGQYPCEHLLRPVPGKEISVLTCSGSKGGDYGVQVDGAPATNLNGYKDPGTQGDQCIVSQTFNSGMLVDGNHNISIIVKGSNSAQLNGGTAVEFGGFMCVTELKEWTCRLNLLQISRPSRIRHSCRNQEQYACHHWRDRRRRDWWHSYTHDCYCYHHQEEA